MGVRYVVAFDSVGGHLEPRVDVRLRPRAVPDRAARCCTTLGAGALGSASLGVLLTPEGLIEAVGGCATGPYGGSPAQAGRTSSGGSTPPTVASGTPVGTVELDHRAAWTRPGCLRAAFDLAHPRTAALIADLSARAEQFLAGLRMGDVPGEVEVFGSALAVVERELAAADRMRREWIAAQGFEVRSGTWDLDLNAVVVVTEPLPDQLPADTPVPLTVAVYRRAPADPDEPGTVPAGQSEWARDAALTQHVEAVDGRSAVDSLRLRPEGHPGGDPALHLSFHPGGSLRAFGVAASPAVAGPAVARVPDGITAPVEPGDPSRSEVAAAALEAARLQLALLQTCDEFTRFAATHAHGGELARLEQDARFAALRSRLT